MRAQIKNVVLAVIVVVVVAACGGSQDAVSADDDVLTDSSTAATVVVEPEPTESPVGTDPEPAANPEPDPEGAPGETEVPDEATVSERGLLPVGITTLPGLYAHEFQDAEMWLDVPEYGPEVQLIVVIKDGWQVTVTILDDERLPDEPTPGFSMALADSGATIESVVDAMRESDAGRFSFEEATGVFAGADAVIVNRVSNLEAEIEPPNDPIITLTTGEVSTLTHLYKVDWAMESYIFERDGRVMIVSYEWAPGLSERQMVLAQAGPVIESIELQDMS